MQLRGVLVRSYPHDLSAQRVSVGVKREPHTRVVRKNVVELGKAIDVADTQPDPLWAVGKDGQIRN
jgi:hypothetical protein